MTMPEKLAAEANRFQICCFRQVMRATIMAICLCLPLGAQVNPGDLIAIPEEVTSAGDAQEPMGRAPEVLAETRLEKAVEVEIAGDDPIPVLAIDGIPERSTIVNSDPTIRLAAAKKNKESSSESGSGSTQATIPVDPAIVIALAFVVFVGGIVGFALLKKPRFRR